MEARIEGSNGTDQLFKTNKKTRKKLFISYSLSASFIENLFIQTLIEELQECGLEEDIVCDQYSPAEIINTPFQLSKLLDTCERCSAAVVILSQSYLQCLQSMNEATILLERRQRSIKCRGKDAINLLVIKMECINMGNSTVGYRNPFEIVDVDLSTGPYLTFSVAEKVASVMSICYDKMFKISRCETRHMNRQPKSRGKETIRGAPLVAWTTEQTQQWLLGLNIRERDRSLFEEYKVNGKLLSTLTDEILLDYIGVDSGVTRKKILRSIVSLQNDEVSQQGGWLRFKQRRAKANVVYFCVDPSDKELAEMFDKVLTAKGYTLRYPSSLGASKEEFLEINRTLIVESAHVMIALTPKSKESIFVFYEALFAEWINRKIIVLILGTTADIRLRTLGLLYKYPSINMSEITLQETVSCLLYYFNDNRNTNAVMSGKFIYNTFRYIRCLSDAMSTNVDNQNCEGPISSKDKNINVYISFELNHETEADYLIKCLQSVGIYGVRSKDVNHMRIKEGSISRHSNNHLMHMLNDCSIAVVLFSERYFSNDVCMNELIKVLVNGLSIIPLLMEWMAWPPIRMSVELKQDLILVKPIDLSNPVLFNRGVSELLDRIKKPIKTVK